MFNLQNDFFFCSTLSEFENFLLCRRILINVKTNRQDNFKDFKQFDSSNKKNVVLNNIVFKLKITFL
jgi:hypothetical protein